VADSRLRDLPSVAAVLADPRVAMLAAGRRRPWVTRLVQQVVDELRGALRRGEERAAAPGREVLLASAVERVHEAYRRLCGPSLRRVINATGVIVHTNLGRSRFPQRALSWLELAALHPVDLELDLASGQRGHRGRRVEGKAALLAGAADALVVNNNAAAVWLAVRVCACGGPVILSRGEAVAIGGSFRMHEILAETGCRLIEVGTTNRTSLQDYERALEPGAVVIKVHRSNFAVVGFTEEVGLSQLSELCRRRGHRLIYDAGSGALFPYRELGLAGERTLAEDLSAGPDMVCCSGDKLLGGCQAGILLGHADLVAAMRAHPMRRAFRVDKITLAALDAVLSLYLEAEDLPLLPTLEQIARPILEIEAVARQLLRELAPAAPAGWHGSVRQDVSSVGGGSFSTASLPTRLLLWEGPKEELEACHARLRMGDPAVVTRMNQEGLAVDPRALEPDDLPPLVEAFRRVWER
jgi:L-seryl-tRNA(Ser) seleniumtransferase